MTFEVVTKQRRPDGTRERVIATTRRFNGAVNERDIMVDSARHNLAKHNPDGRIVVGPTEVENEIAVIAIDNGEIVADIRVGIRQTPSERELPAALAATLSFLSCTQATA